MNPTLVAVLFFKYSFLACFSNPFCVAINTKVTKYSIGLFIGLHFFLLGGGGVNSFVFRQQSSSSKEKPQKEKEKKECTSLCTVACV